MKLLVTGGRDFNDIELALDSIAFIHEAAQIDLLIHGDASGADNAADRVATELGIQRVKIPANWQGLGKRAGILRNQLMLDMFMVDLVLAFPGGRGTQDMISRAHANDIPVVTPADLFKATPASLFDTP